MSLSVSEVVGAGVVTSSVTGVEAVVVDAVVVAVVAPVVGGLVCEVVDSDVLGGSRVTFELVTGSGRVVAFVSGPRAVVVVVVVVAVAVVVVSTPLDDVLGETVTGVDTRSSRTRSTCVRAASNTVTFCVCEV